MYYLTMIFFRNGAWQVLVHVLIGFIDNTVESTDCEIGLVQSKTLYIVSSTQDRQHDDVADVLFCVLKDLETTRSS